MLVHLKDRLETGSFEDLVLYYFLKIIFKNNEFSFFKSD